MLDAISQNCPLLCAHLENTKLLCNPHPSAFSCLCLHIEQGMKGGVCLSTPLAKPSYKMRYLYQASEAENGSQQDNELTQGNQGRDLLVGGLYMRVYFDLKKLKQLTIFSFPPLSLCLGCLSDCLGLFGCLEFLNI